MKKALTFALVLGFTTAVSAQFLTRTQRFKVKNSYYDKQFVINLDTMPQVQFISVCFNCWYEDTNLDLFDIGDGLVWKWVDETLKPIKTKGDIDGLNRFAKLNWMLQMPLYSMRTDANGGNSSKEWLFKRRETK